MKSAPGIAFDYRPSRLIALAVSAITLFAVLAVLLSGLPFWQKIVIALIALISGALGLRRHLTRDVVRIARGEGGWRLVDREGRESVVTLAGHVQRGFLLVLAFAGEGWRQRRLVLAPDNIDRETRRRLLLVLAVGEGKSS